MQCFRLTHFSVAFRQTVPSLLQITLRDLLQRRCMDDGGVSTSLTILLTKYLMISKYLLLSRDILSIIGSLQVLTKVQCRRSAQFNYVHVDIVRFGKDGNQQYAPCDR